MHPLEAIPSSPKPAELRSRVLTRSDKAAWNDIIRSLPEEHRFLADDWTALLEEAYGYSSHLLTLEEKGRIVAALPLSVIRSVFTGKRAVSLPFFDRSLIHSPDQDLITPLFQELVKVGREQNLDYVEVRGGVERIKGSSPSLAFYNHIVDLSQGSDAVFSNFASSTRRAIRKAQKTGVAVDISTSRIALRGYYDLHCETRRRHGLPPQPYSFFELLHKRLIETGKGVIVSATFESKLAASAIYLQQGNTIHYKYGASDETLQQSRCNNLVMWTALEHYSQQGFLKMDFGRNSLKNQEGLRKYKLNYGASEQVIHYLRYNLKTNKAVAMSDDVFGWHNKLFANLPISLNRLAGKFLYRHIA